MLRRGEQGRGESFSREKRKRIREAYLIAAALGHDNSWFKSRDRKLEKSTSPLTLMPQMLELARLFSP
jgi:hypothetical protein